MYEVAAGARSKDHCKFSGPAVEPVVAAVSSIMPGDFGAADARRIRVDGTCFEIDFDPPSEMARQIGAGKGPFCTEKGQAEHLEDQEYECQSDVALQ